MIIRNYLKMVKDDEVQFYIHFIKTLCTYRLSDVHLEDWKHPWKHFWKAWDLINLFGLEVSNRILYHWKHKMHITAIEYLSTSPGVVIYFMNRFKLCMCFGPIRRPSCRCLRLLVDLMGGASFTSSSKYNYSIS